MDHLQLLVNTLSIYSSMSKERRITSEGGGGTKKVMDVFSIVKLLAQVDGFNRILHQMTRILLKVLYFKCSHG